MSKKDNSPKACIHLTQAQKVAALQAVGVTPRKGAAPAMVRAIPKWATAHPEAAAALAPFVAAEMPATMSAGQKAARAIARADKPESVIIDAAAALPDALRELLLAELSKEASDTKTAAAALSKAPKT